MIPTIKIAIKALLPKQLLNYIIYKKNNIKILNTTYDETVSFAYEADVRNSSIGSYTSIGRFAKITHTEFGKFCSISWDVTINAVSHPFTTLSTHAFPYVPHSWKFVNSRKQEYKKVIIKNDVWIGANSVIMPGVIIGNGAIIGAGAVVTKDVPDYAIVVGVPAKILRYRFNKDKIERLLELKWWNLDFKTIKENISLWEGDFNCDALKKLEQICKL